MNPNDIIIFPGNIVSIGSCSQLCLLAPFKPAPFIDSRCPIDPLTSYIASFLPPLLPPEPVHMCIFGPLELGICSIERRYGSGIVSREHAQGSFVRTFCRQADSRSYPGAHVGRSHVCYVFVRESFLSSVSGR